MEAPPAGAGDLGHHHWRIDALRASNWNQTEAARLLDMPVRTLQHKVKQLGLKKLGYGV